MSVSKRLIAAAGAVAAAFAVHGAGSPARAAEAAVAAAIPTASDFVQIPADNMMVIDTTKGRIVVEMYPEVAPEHVTQIKAIVRMGYYDGLQFFRVIDDFMAQTGDAANTGAGPGPMPTLKGTFNFRRGPESGFVEAGRYGPGGVFGYIGALPIHSQPSDLGLFTADGKVKSWGTFCTGVAGMARTSNPDSASSQFFLMRGYTENLDDMYTPWGKVVLGQEVVAALNVGEPPAQPDVMTRVQIASDMPEAERPNLWRENTAGAAFKARVAAAQAASGADFAVCDVVPMVQAR
jgi:peptidylprolyl isomerase